MPLIIKTIIAVHISAMIRKPGLTASVATSATAITSMGMQQIIIISLWRPWPDLGVGSGLFIMTVQFSAWVMLVKTTATMAVHGENCHEKKDQQPVR